MHLVQYLLVVGVGVDGGHQPVADAEVVVEHLHHGGEAVGGAGRIGDDVVIVGIVFAVVDPQHHGQVLATGGRGDNHLLGAPIHVRPCLGRVGKDAGALHHHLHAVLAPWDAAGVALR